MQGVDAPHHSNAEGAGRGGYCNDGGMSERDQRHHGETAHNDGGQRRKACRERNRSFDEAGSVWREKGASNSCKSFSGFSS